MARSVLSEEHFQTEEAALAYIEARLWPNGPTCPFCGATAEHIGELNGKTTRAGLRKCYACDKPFTVRIGTIFEASHLPLNLWLQVIHLMCASKKGISTRQIQRMLSCSMKTAWHLTHRIREAMKDGGLEPLGGPARSLKPTPPISAGKNATNTLASATPATSAAWANRSSTLSSNAMAAPARTTSRALIGRPCAQSSTSTLIALRRS